MKGLYFLLGVGVGSAVTYFVLKDKFAAIAQEEIDSVKDAYKPIHKQEQEEPIKTNMEEKPPIKEYFKKVEESGYKDYSTKVERPDDPVHKPFREDAYIITPEEFGEIEDYEQESLIIYSDGVIANDIDDEIFEEADEKLTPDFNDHIGDYEDNVVHIRNDIEKTDYAVYRDNRTYEEVTGNKPSRPVAEE